MKINESSQKNDKRCKKLELYFEEFFKSSTRIRQKPTFDFETPISLGIKNVGPVRAPNSGCPKGHLMLLLPLTIEDQPKMRLILREGWFVPVKSRGSD